MPNEPIWLPLSEIIETNRSEVARTNEPHLILNYPLLHSGCTRPKNMWAYGENVDIAELAVCLLLGIARNHPFQQGNKRTGFISALMFLRINGYDLNTEDEPPLSEMIIQAVEHEITDDVLVEFFRKFLVKRPI